LAKGGIILLGVDDYGAIVGISERCKYNDESIINTIRQSCTPFPEYGVDERRFQEKDILVIHVK
jgi:predicted HTH transcriptional regulator